MIDTSLAVRALGGPAGVIRLLRRLGPAFVRYGQILAQRPDLLPPEFRDEFLLEPAEVSQPLPWSEARTILAAEILNIDTAFQSIDPVPVFSNGLSQAHPAVTATGDSVLIKFLLPGARKRAQRDARRARAFARWAPSERPLIEELALLVDAELDLVAERENIGKLADASGSSPFLRVPRVYPELSTAQVLTRENLGGVPLSAVLSPARRSTFKAEEIEFDARALAIHLIDGAVRQILQQHFYCVDVRPQNLLLLPGNTLSFVNFHHCAAVDRENSLIYTQFLNEVFSTELPRLARSFEALLIATDSSASETMREEFIRQSHECLRSAPPAHRIRSAADFSSPLSNWLAAILRVARHHEFEISIELLSVFRTLVSLETVAIRLDPGVHLQSTGQEILKDIVLENVFERMEPVKVRSALVNLLTALNNAPEYLHHILTDSAEGRLSLGLSATEHPHAAATRDRRYRLLAVSIAAVGVAWLMGERGLPPAGPISATRLLGLVLCFLYFSMIVLWRRLQ